MGIFKKKKVEEKKVTKKKTTTKKKASPKKAVANPVEAPKSTVGEFSLKNLK